MRALSWERIVDATPDPLVLVDRQAAVLHANPAAARLLGLRAGGDPAGPIAALLAAPFAEEAWPARLLDASIGGNVLSLRTSGDAPVRVEASVHPIGESSDDPLLLRLHAADTCDYRTAYERLGTAYALLDTLFENAPIGLALVTTELRYARVNARLAEINGFPAEHHVGKRVTDLFGASGRVLEDCQRKVLETLEPAIREEFSSHQFDFPGDRCWELSIYPVVVEGQLVGLGTVVDEITERVHAERERSRLLAESQAAVQARDEFLSIASHELKTPLTPLSVRLAMLEQALAHGEPGHLEWVRSARASVEKLALLINDLLDASRIAAGRLSLQLAPVRLDALANRCAIGGEREGHPVRVEVPSEPVVILGDEPRLEQVLENLVDNAARYSPPGAPIRVRLEDHRDHVRLAVTDAGIGVQPELASRLFERYFRAPDARRVAAGGLGLGLYISRDIVELHGGRIGVESTPGKGSTFWVELPSGGPVPAIL